MGIKSKSTQWHLIVILTRGTDNATCHTQGLDMWPFFSKNLKKFKKFKKKSKKLQTDMWHVD